ncbi:MAG: DUF4013 domain-containing protein [Methanobrevibacter sp.]|nr:DUF4013 domain-containing protein [Methanobrevibacter sp.]
MPIDIVKGSLKYCMENKLFFLFVLIIFAVIEYLFDIVNTPISGFTSLLFAILVMGYGLQIIKDVIDGGTRLPKIMPKKVIILGFKGSVIHLFYMGIQIFLLASVAVNLNFPVFEIEEFFLEYHNTILLIFNHDAVSCIIFVVSGFVITYVTSFFMELSLARLADGGQLRKSFNFRRIKHAIDLIGWKNYTIGYSKIIFIILVFSHIEAFFDQFYGLNGVMGVLSFFVIFIIEYRGMGNVYKVYTDLKKNVDDKSST